MRVYSRNLILTINFGILIEIVELHYRGHSNTCYVFAYRLYVRTQLNIST